MAATGSSMPSKRGYRSYLLSGFKMLSASHNDAVACGDCSLYLDQITVGRTRLYRDTQRVVLLIKLEHICCVFAKQKCIARHNQGLARLSRGNHDLRRV